jgi:hypothetical protein
LGFASNKIDFVNRIGSNTIGNQFYFAALGRTESEWTTFKGYFQGLSDTPFADESPDINTPGALHTNVFYIAPFVLGNNNDLPGKTVFDYIKLTNISTGKVLFLDSFENYKTESDILEKWTKVEVGELSFIPIGETIQIPNEIGIRFPVDFTFSVPTGQDLELAPITIENATYGESYTMNDSFGPPGKKGPKTVDSVNGVIKLDGVDESSGLSPGSVWPTAYYGDNIFTIAKVQDDLEVSVKYKRRWFL